MKAWTPTGIVTAALAISVTACAPEPEPAAERVAQTRPVVMEPALAASGADALPPHLISQLREQYPVLRREPAPEPQPSADADPTRVPERVREALPQRVLQTVQGGATVYADKFEGRRTASGIPFRQNQMVAAHRSFPFGTLLRVTNLDNDRAVNVRVVDRGPFGGAANQRRTLLDLSRRAATQLGYTTEGRTQVRVEVLEWGEGLPRTS